MKKQIISYILAATFIFAAVFTSCKKDEKPKTVTVAAQAGTMTAGAAETVTFAVTTENIANGSYDAAMANLPTGVNVQGKVTITGNSGTLTLNGSVATVAGTYPTLTLTIDRTTSNAFTLTIAPAPTYTISALPATLQFGSLQSPYTQPAAQTVVITNTGTGTVTLNALPTVANYTLGALSENSLAAGAQATFTVRPNAGLTAGTYSPTITVTGSGGVNATVSVSFEVTTAGSNTYAISVSPTTLPFGSLQTPYTQPAAQTVTITNTGTGTVTLNALPAVANYTLGALSTNTLAAGAQATFTVQPNAGLAVGTYNADIIVTGSNGASATVSVSFEVTEGSSTYAISASPTTLQFGTLQSPYTQPAAQTVTITNTGTGTVTLNALPAVTNYTLGALSSNTLAAGAQATFTVRPNAGLAAGTYNREITITGSNGASATVRANFEVMSGEPDPAGDGSRENPFKVANFEDLEKVGRGYYGWSRYDHYEQTANIIIPSGTDWWPIDGEFNGSYDGGGFSISNLVSESNGLFIWIGLGGEVRNVALLNVNINNVDDFYQVGGVAGYNNGIIQNCYVTGSVSGLSIVGGVAGWSGGTVENCYTTCKVNGQYVGGIVGYISSKSVVQNCYATGNISSHNYDGGGYNDAGGVVGTDESCTIKNCVALNKEIKLTTNDPHVNMIGRVVGYLGYGSAILYARTSGMILTKNNVNVTLEPYFCVIDERHGANVSQADYNGNTSGTWWRVTAGFSPDYWDMANNRLPRLKTTDGKAFSQAQNPTVTP